MNIAFHIFLLPIFLILSAFFSGSESAIFSLTEYEKNKIKSQHAPAWKRLTALLEKPTNTITLIITGNIIVNTAATSILGVLLYRFFPEIKLVFSILIVTSIILFIGEIFPKLIALRLASKLSVFAVYFLKGVSKLIFPLEAALVKAAMKITSFADINVKELETKPALSELYAIVKSGEEKGILEKDERVLTEKILDFGKRWLNEIMTPRTDVVAFSDDVSYEQVEALIKSSKHTKYPVFKKSIDSVIGVLYARDLLFKSYSSWKELVYPILAVPESMNIDELLLQFKERNEEIALVVDEFGGTAGIVTLEDILEELVGEIEDEYKKEKTKIKVINPTTFVVSGNISLNELSEAINKNIKTDGITTLAGLLLNLFQKVPSSGQSIEYKDLKFFIDEVSKNKIKKVTIKKMHN